MRARKRRSVFNTISAAMLEVSIMGLFVILAQPQLRDALFELINPGSVPVATAPVNKNISAPTSALESTVHAVLSSPVGQAFGKAIEEKLADANIGQAPTWLAEDAGQRVARYAPLEQYESFRVSVPSTSPAQAAPATTPPSLSTYVPQSHGSTQLAPNQWNVASVSQSTLPPLNYNNWAPVHSAQTSYRDIYPPPYGTQSQWK